MIDSTAEAGYLSSGGLTDDQAQTTDFVFLFQAAYKILVERTSVRRSRRGSEAFEVSYETPD